MNWFIAKSAERSLPFFKILKGSDHFKWGAEQQEAFDKLKKYLTTLTALSSPNPEAELLLYIAASPSAISVILVQERQENDKLHQFSIYYVSEALAGPKRFYSEMEKMAYALVMASRKLLHYFNAHKITVPTSLPLHDMFENCKATGRIRKWTVVGVSGTGGP